jgi:hypothetical protein
MTLDFSERMRRLALDRGIGEESLAAYELANPRIMSVDGIGRYWRKQAGESPRARA